MKFIQSDKRVGGRVEKVLLVSCSDVELEDRKNAKFERSSVVLTGDPPWGYGFLAGS